MNQLFLLKLILDLLKSDKPTVEQISCARTILKNLIEAHDKPVDSAHVESDLDSDALQAQKELL